MTQGARTGRYFSVGRRGAPPPCVQQQYAGGIGGTELNRTKIYVIGLAAACFFLAANAFAGTTTVVGGVVSYAREVGVANAVYTLPTQTITRSMNVIRDSTHD